MVSATIELNVDDPDGAWETYMNGIMGNQSLPQNWDSATGKPRLPVGDMNEETIQQWVDYIISQNPGLAGVQWSFVQ